MMVDALLAPRPEWRAFSQRSRLLLCTSATHERPRTSGGCMRAGLTYRVVWGICAVDLLIVVSSSVWVSVSLRLIPERHALFAPASSFSQREVGRCFAP
jgi:hypothetical protein